MYRYSQRLSWPLRTNALAKQREARREQDLPTLDLTCSNPTEVLTKYPHSEIAEALCGIDSFRYEPSPTGTARARLAVQRYYADRRIKALPERMLLTASTSEAYGWLFKLLCDPGDEVLTPRPSYPLFEYLASLESVRIRNYYLHFDGRWFIDFDHLRQQITSQTRAIIIVNPNNPTGSFLKTHELMTLMGLATEYKLPLISDEVFLDYGLQADPDRTETLIGYDEVLSFSLSGLSKSAGMPQMKLGWILVNGPGDDANLARERLALIADTYLSVATPVQAAAPRLFDIGVNIQRDIRLHIRENWATLKSNLTDTPANALECEGGWSAVIRLPATLTEDAWVSRLLSEYGLIVEPGWFFDMEQERDVVVSLISRPEDFKEGISRLRQLAMQS